MEKYKIKLGFTNYFTMDCQDRKGSFALFWSTKVQVVIQNYSKIISMRLMKEKISITITGILQGYMAFWSRVTNTKLENC